LIKWNAAGSEGPTSWHELLKMFNERDHVAAGRFPSPTGIQHSAHIQPGRWSTRADKKPASNAELRAGGSDTGLGTVGTSSGGGDYPSEAIRPTRHHEYATERSHWHPSF